MRYFYRSILIIPPIGVFGLMVNATALFRMIPLLAGLPLIFGVDRLFDMMRTATNVLGHASCAIISNRILDKEASHDR